MLNNLKSKIDKLNSNVNDAANNRKARRLKAGLVIAGIFTLLLGIGCGALAFYFIISGFSFSTDLTKMGHSFSQIVSSSMAGFFLFLPAGLFIILGSSLLLSSMKIAIVDISANLIKSSLKQQTPNKNICQYCGSANEKGRANCQNCGAPIRVDNTDNNSQTK